MYKKELSPGRIEILAMLPVSFETISIIISEDQASFFDVPLGKSVTTVKDVDSGQEFQIKQMNSMLPGQRTDLLATPMPRL